MTVCARFVALSFSVCVLTTSTHAAVIFAQPLLDDVGAFASSSTAASNPSLFADDFETTSPVEVLSATWWGTEISNTDMSYTANLLGWQLRFYADDAGLPGTPISQQDIALASVTLTEVDPGVFRHEALLPLAVNLAPDTYWLAIGANVIDDQLGDLWG